MNTWTFFLRRLTLGGGKNCLLDMEIIALKRWFIANRRDLPWRRNPTPYRVWISEIMLQQTQALVVIPYFEKWIERFPTLEDLSEATLEEVLKMWEGLGYYSRARNIHAAAKEIARNGCFPQTKDELEKIKGLGPYTVGAILGFGFKQKAAAVDGNVARVLARYYFIEDDVTSTSTQKRLRMLVETLLPDEEPWVVMEAFIELGALICQKQPKCHLCPLKNSCLGKDSDLPRRGKNIEYVRLQKKIALVRFQNEILLKKGVKGKVMADLYQFPEYEEIPSLNLQHVKQFDIVKHSYTRFRVELHPSLCVAKEKQEIEGLCWITLENAKLLPFSSGHRQLFLQFCMSEA